MLQTARPRRVLVLHATDRLFFFEQLAGLYKGIVSPLAGIGIVNGLVFSAFKKSLDYLSPLAETPEGHEPKLSLVFLAGCASGVVGSCVPPFLCLLLCFSVRG